MFSVPFSPANKLKSIKCSSYGWKGLWMIWSQFSEMSGWATEYSMEVFEILAIVSYSHWALAWDEFWVLFPVILSIIVKRKTASPIHVFLCESSYSLILFSYLCLQEGFPGVLDSKESNSNFGDLGSLPGLERSPGGGHGNPLWYSCLENPHGWRSLQSYSSWGHKELDTTERLSTAHAFEVVEYSQKTESFAQHVPKIFDFSPPLLVFIASFSYFMWSN